MRKFLVLLALLLTCGPLFAVKPEKKSESLEDSLAYINKTLYPTMDYFYGCSEKIMVTLSEKHQELIVTHLPVDGSGRIKRDLPPIFVYRIALADVTHIYPWGMARGFSSHVGYDRIMITTNGRGVSKYGPYWDCFHRKVSKKTRLRYLNNTALRIDNLDDSQLIHLIKALKNTVALSQEEADAPPNQQQPDAAAAPQEQPHGGALDDDNGYGGGDEP
jgi:UDP:flavonoid glycosyltransferase YjiC (YdhE family)